MMVPTPAVGAPQISPPFWLLAELTYQCPLHCAFCYNPLNYDGVRDELTTGEWVRVMREARALGAVQLGSRVASR